MRFALELAALALLLHLVQEAFRRTDKGAALSVFLGLPLILTPIWIQTNQFGVFPWVKLYSILVFACWLTAIRFTSIGRRRWALVALFVMLPANILEAVVQDCFRGGFSHILLGTAGILIVVALPHPIRGIQLDTPSRHRDLLYEGMTREWIIAYTVWNWAFLYLNFPIIAGRHLAVLAAAFAVGMIDPRRWLQARAYTLAVDLLLLATFPKIFLPPMDTSHWVTPDRENFVAIVCLVIVGVYAIWFFGCRATSHGYHAAAVPISAGDSGHTRRDSRPRGRVQLSGDVARRGGRW